jgi:hypothetical protein
MPRNSVLKYFVCCKPCRKAQCASLVTYITMASDTSSRKSLTVLFHLLAPINNSQTRPSLKLLQLSIPHSDMNSFQPSSIFHLVIGDSYMDVYSSLLHKYREVSLGAIHDHHFSPDGADPASTRFYDSQNLLIGHCGQKILSLDQHLFTNLMRYSSERE